MHEYGLAEEIAGHVAREAERKGACGLALLDVEVGGLANLNVDLLATWLRETLPDGLSPGVRVHVRRAPLLVICERCGHRERLGARDDDQRVAIVRAMCQRCPACRSEGVRVDGTAGCRIRAVKFRF